jgi:DNA-binding LytR/AlgR family response regulator
MSKDKVITCLLVDDEPLALGLLANFAARIPELTVAGKFRDPVSAYEFLQTEKVDLLFLDIQMPQMSGLELLQSLEDGPVSIFTTAHDNYALQAFDLKAADYLMKPFSFERFCQAVDRAKLLIPGTQPAGPKTIQVKLDRQWINLPVDDIIYVEGWKEYLRIHCSEKVVTTFMRFHELEKHLLEPAFIRIHKSFIVAADKVIGFEKDTVTLSNEVNLPISKNRKQNVLELLQQRDGMAV